MFWFKHILERLCASWNRCKDSGIIRRFGIDNTTIFRGRTFRFTGTFFDFPTGKRASPFTAILIIAVAPVNYRMPTRTDGNPFFVNSDCTRIGEITIVTGIKVNEWNHTPFITQFISGIVVMS